MIRSCRSFLKSNRSESLLSLFTKRATRATWALLFSLFSNTKAIHSFCKNWQERITLHIYSRSLSKEQQEWFAPVALFKRETRAKEQRAKIQKREFPTLAPMLRNTADMWGPHPIRSIMYIQMTQLLSKTKFNDFTCMSFRLQPRQYFHFNLWRV